MVKGKIYPTGLIITDTIKRTPEENAGDVKAYPHHTIEGLPAKVDWRTILIQPDI